jgi:tetratricopeptide (TPR) repeat protein
LRTDRLPAGMLPRGGVAGRRRRIWRVQDVGVKGAGMLLAVSRSMNTISPPGAPLALEPMEVSTPDDDTVRRANDGSIVGAEGQTGLRATAADTVLAAATKEHKEGHVDGALWARALAQSGADESLAMAAYLRARATALRLQARDRRAERRARKARSLQDATKRDTTTRATTTREARKHKVDAEAHPEDAAAPVAGVRLGGAQPKLKYAVMAAVALASVVAVVGLLAPPQASESAGQSSMSVATPSAARSSPAAAVENALPVAGSTSAGTNHDDGRPSLEVRVQQLKEAGNWNVLVLYASEWTRKEPGNASAWTELSIGYANLRQFNDALGAAEKAVGLSPQDARLWRNLGHLNLDLERLPEAGSAFDRVLALSSEDADALCGAAMVAQRLGRTKDADAIARRAKAADGGCPGLGDGESVAVVARKSAARQPASAVGR